MIERLLAGERVRAILRYLYQTYGVERKKKQNRRQNEAGSPIRGINPVLTEELLFWSHGIISEIG